MQNLVNATIKIESVWPQKPHQRRQRQQPTPLELMQAQADGLAEYTERAVIGDIATFNPSNSSTIRHTSYAKVPAMSDYTYSLFHVHYQLGIHNGQEYYPVELLPSASKKSITCGDAANFKEELTRLLTSDAVLSVIDQLKELSERAKTPGPR